MTQSTHSTLLSAVLRMASALVLLACAAGANAQWTKSLEIPGAYAVFSTSQNTLLATSWDYDNPNSKAIYRSTDAGKTWTATKARQNYYTNYCEADGKIFVNAEGCRVARSDDDGQTWMILNYQELAAKYASEKELPYIQAYGICYDPELKRLYVAVFSPTVGVIYSDDFGETWKVTHRQSQLLDFGGGVQEMDTYYNMAFFNGKAYVMGLYTVKVYDPKTDRWTNLIHNCQALGVVTEKDGRLFLGHGMEIEPGYFLLSTPDGKVYTKHPLPNDEVYAYVRALNSDDKNIYVGVRDVYVRYSPDNATTWYEAGKGLPRYHYTSLANDNENLYVAVYHADKAKSGIWQIAKADLNKVPVNGIEGAAADESGITYLDGVLTVQGAAFADLRICDLTGRTVAMQRTAAYDTSVLAPGTYVYTARVGNKTVTGKFIR